MSLSEEKIELTEIEISKLLNKIDFPISNNKIELDIEKYNILGDSDLLEVVIRNLVQNSSNAEPKDNKILIKGQILENGKYRIFVIDKGKGIPKEHIKRVTEDFYMVDKARSRKNGSSGIGLSLVKRILNLHNSDIIIESEENIGTTVYFDLEGKDYEEKISNIIIYIIVVIIILASFIIPSLLLEMQELDIEMAVYNNDNTENNKKLSVEAEDIYLVKAIHDIESEKIGVTIQSAESSEKILTTNDVNSDKISEIKKEIEKLEEYNIINNVKSSSKSKLLIGIINKVYQKDKIKYTINNVSLTQDNYNYQMDVEEKTGKIIRLAITKDKLNNEIETKEILKNYIQYLDLYIIDDWVFEDNMMKSQKADLLVNLIESVNDGTCMLSIHSTTKISDNLIEYIDIK